LTTIISGDHGFGKPNPLLFQKASEELGVSISQCVMIGNSLENDIAGARAAGMRSIWIRLCDPSTTENISSDFIIGDLRELPSLLKTME
jgi:putative hydrolase of the HAD superfamily